VLLLKGLGRHVALLVPRKMDGVLSPESYKNLDNIKDVIMRTIRYPYLCRATTVFLCAFMFYNCRVDYVGATAEEKSAADSPPASRIHQCTSSGLLAALSFPLSSSTTAYVSPSRSLITLTDRRLFSVMSFGLSLSPPAPSLVATVCTTSKASSDLQPAAVLGDSYALQSQLSTMPVFIFSSLFTTASGERVKFSQAGGQWHATIQAGSGAYTSPRTLPVVSSSDIGSFLSWLRYQDMWTSRARIHVLDTSQAPNGSCIYLGKAGLLGGMPEFPSRGVSQELGATLQEVWVQGPTMHLEGNQTRTEVCYIQSGFRYKGYRIKEGSVIRRASYTISYVEADARAEINKLARCSNESELEEKLSTGFAQFVNLGNRAENVGSAQVRGHQSAHQFSLAHAAIMLYGSTKKNKIFQKKKSCLSLALEIQVVPDSKIELASFLSLQRAYSPKPDIDLEQDIDALLARKLANPECVLSDSESIALLTHCVAEGDRNSAQIKKKNALIVIGTTGAGKSTFLNYLMGCKLQLEDPARLGLPGLEDIIVVSPNSPVKEVMPIGHTRISKTFISQIEVDRGNATMVYCDCLGFLDNRGAEINIANSVNIRRILQAAQSVKVLILLNYRSLLADRSRGLADMLNMCTQLFGGLAHLERFKGALLLGVTQAPATLRLHKLHFFMTDGGPSIMKTLAQRTFLYDPMDRGGEDFWDRSMCHYHLDLLQEIPQHESWKIFQTVLTDSDERRLGEIVAKQRKTLRKALRSGAYSVAGLCWRNLQRLRVIDHVSVERMLNDSRLMLQHILSRRIASFRENSVYHRFSEAEIQLAAMRSLASQFNKEDFLLPELDITELTRHLEYFKQQKEEADRTAIIDSIVEQKCLMEQQFMSQRIDFSKEQSRLRLEIVRLDAGYDDQIKKIQSERREVFQKQEKETFFRKMLSEGEYMKQLAKQASLLCEYEAKLSEVEAEKLSVRSECEAMLQSHQEAWRQSKLTTQEKISQLEAQIEVLLVPVSMPSLAFGAKEWKKYFGDVGQEPSLPNNIEDILNAPCPFFRSKKVRDTHLLVLIPASVDGVPFTLNLLGKMVQQPKNSRHKAEFGFNIAQVRTKIGENSPFCPYWLLMTRDVLEKSRGKAYSKQRELIKRYAKKTGLCYELPGVLEAATAILMHHARAGERLFGDSPWTYTRCRELIEDKYPILVGGFDSLGLAFSFYYFDISFYGVSCCRKF
jgi:energy-coupling factor transporter ATP-binding protein EcfA2